jgi:uncharacterized protein YegP (UPF0339 family)
MTDEAPRLELRERVDGLWDWHLVASNGEELCGTQQGYRDQHDAHRGFDDTLTALAALIYPVCLPVGDDGFTFGAHHVRIDVRTITKAGEDLDGNEDAPNMRHAKHAAKHAERATRNES